MSTYNVTLNDYSPLIQYSGTWQACFDLSGCVPQSNGVSGLGQGYHQTTGQNGAMVSLNFYGNGIYIFGDSSSSLDLVFTLDNAFVIPTLAPSGQTLSSLITSFTSLAEGKHVVTVQTNAPLNFSSAVVEIPSPSSPTITTLQYWSPTISYTGTWQVDTNSGIQNGTMWTSLENASASLEFNGTDIIAFSTLNWGHGPYTVTLDGETYAYTPGTAAWFIPQSVIFYQTDLDPSTTHKLTFTNSGTTGTFTLTDLIIMQPGPNAVSSATAVPTSGTQSNSSGAHSFNYGPVIGGVIGAVSAVILAMVLFSLVRCPRFRRRTSADAVALDDPDLGGTNAAETLAQSYVKLANMNQASGLVPPAYAPQGSYVPQEYSTTSFGPSPAVTTAPSSSSVTMALSPTPSTRPRHRPPVNTSYDTEPQSQVVDRLVELLAARMDPGQSGVSGTGDVDPPRYGDHGRAN